MDSSNDDWVYIPGTRYREYVGMVARGVWSACVCVVVFLLLVCGVQCGAVAAVQVVHCPLCIPPVLRYRRKTVEGVLRWWLVRVGVVLFTLAGRLPTCRGARKPLQQAIGSYLLAGNDNLATEPGDRDAPHTCSPRSSSSHRRARRRSSRRSAPRASSWTPSAPPPCQKLSTLGPHTCTQSDAEPRPLTLTIPSTHMHTARHRERCLASLQ